MYTFYSENPEGDDLLALSFTLPHESSALCTAFSDAVDFELVVIVILT